MADVIRAALDEHRPGWKDGGVMCRGCCWRFVPDKDGWQEVVDRHLADVVRDVVLEVTGRVLAGHWLSFGYDHDARCRGCDWESHVGCGEDNPTTYADHVQALVVAALAGEG